MDEEKGLTVCMTDLEASALSNTMSCAELKQCGIIVKSGVWSVEEKNQLEKNWKDYQKSFPMEDPYQLIEPGYTGQEDITKEERLALYKIRRDTEFFNLLGDGISRSKDSFLKQAIRMFHPHRNTSDSVITDEKITLMKELFARHGQKYTLIARELRVTPRQVKHICHKLKQNKFSQGKWTEKEEKKMSTALRKIAKVDPADESLYKDSKRYQNLPWRKISAKVKTRSDKQCREKWLNTMSMRITDTDKEKTSSRPRLLFGKKWSIREDRRLIKHISKQKVKQVSDIEWLQVVSQFKEAYSNDYLRRKFNLLVRRNVENSATTTFSEIMATLKKKYIL